MRNLRPELSASVMKSTDQTWLAATASGSGWRTVLRFRPRLLLNSGVNNDMTTDYKPSRLR